MKPGLRKWSVAVLAMVLGFVAALAGKLNAELAGLLGTVVTGFFAANGYTTGKGGEATAG